MYEILYNINIVKTYARVQQFDINRTKTEYS